MRVRILRNVARHPKWTEGSEHDISESEAAELLRRGLVEVLAKAVPQQPVKAVPIVEGSVEKAERDMQTYRDKQKATSAGK